jgi:hypothetical protein
VNHVSEFAFRDRLIIDGDESLVGVVTGIMFREGMVYVELCWMSSGEAKESRIEEWRLSKK